MPSNRDLALRMSKAGMALERGPFTRVEPAKAEAKTSGLVYAADSLCYMHRLFYQAGRHQQVLLRQWFSMGVLVAAMLATSALFIMAREIMQTVQWAIVVSQPLPCYSVLCPLHHGP